MTDDQVEAATDMLAKMLAPLKLPHDGIRAMAHHTLAAAEAVAWQPIETAPKCRTIVLWCPPREGLAPLISTCRWHPSAGFCVDELREPTHWRPLPEPPK